MASLTIKDVCKAFGSVEVLKGINIDAVHGEFLVLVGPSGCGKSTLLNLIAGLESITSGEIRIGERVVNKVAPKDRDIAMVFQSYALYPNMTVRKNISFGLETRKVPKDEIEKVILKVAGILQIEDLLDRKPSQLSGGQRQRVAMGRAIARNPAVFLFDEPLSNLDAKLRVEMRTEIKKLHQRLDTTIVYVTHDQIEAMTLADRIAILKDGIVQQVGTPREVYETPANLFVASFIGSPAMNFIPASVVRSANEAAVILRNKAGKDFTVKISSGQEALSELIDGQELILGIRPEHASAGFVGRDDASLAHLDCEVNVVEPTGPDTLVYTTLNDREVVCRVHPDLAKRAGETMSLALDMSKALFFDPKTELRIAAR
ncbi:MAG: ABC transporter ATP-binding protein [Desulfovibrio sp.]|uniref:ABC transporter ATP-binding protein n=1 Tax=Desulfovibrio sp. 7SRBS1 TaxID=3378064 RepID=UPI003B3D759C